MSEYERPADELALVRSRIPYLYDFFYELDQVWPFYTMAWGPMNPGHSTLPDPSISHKFDSQSLYYAQSTSSMYNHVWNSLNGPPHLLIQAEVALPTQYNVVDMARVAQMPSDPNSSHDEYAMWIKDKKKVIHPGEVNRIAVVPSNNQLVVTHTDHPRVLLWDFATQKNRQAKTGATCSIPDLQLIGHDHSEDFSQSNQSDDQEKIMYFALDVCKSDPLVASGGPDKNVLVWSIEDYQSAAVSGSQTSKSIYQRDKFVGHTACVEDVAWHPSSSKMLASVGDDRSLRLWDLRTGHQGLLVATGHQDDVNALAWNPKYDQYILTASSDKSVHLIDIRFVRESVASTRHLIAVFDAHDRDVKCVSWAPDGKNFASGGDDARVNVWTLNNSKIGDTLGSETSKTSQNFFINREYSDPIVEHPLGDRTVNKQTLLNPQVAYANMLRKITNSQSTLKFSHKVHPSAILSLNWNPHHPINHTDKTKNNIPFGQTICSVSGINGGVMQIWRINELLYMPILASTEKVRVGKRLRSMEAEAMKPTNMRPGNNQSNNQSNKQSNNQTMRQSM